MSHLVIVVAHFDVLAAFSDANFQSIILLFVSSEG
jgi:hypothetical protein